jgi:hypothetical protein
LIGDVLNGPQASLLVSRYLCTNTNKSQEVHATDSNNNFCSATLSVAKFQQRQRAAQNVANNAMVSTAANGAVESRINNSNSNNHNLLLVKILRNDEKC